MIWSSWLMTRAKLITLCLVVVTFILLAFNPFEFKKIYADPKEKTIQYLENKALSMQRVKKTSQNSDYCEARTCSLPIILSREWSSHTDKFSAPSICRKPWPTGFDSRQSCSMYKRSLLQGILFYESLREFGVKDSRLLNSHSQFAFLIDHSHANLVYAKQKIPILFPLSIFAFSCSNWIHTLTLGRSFKYFFAGNPSPPDRLHWLSTMDINDKNSSIIDLNPSGRSVKKLTCDYDWGYYRHLLNAKFALTPRGDFRWSYRFFEAIIFGAIPVLPKADYDPDTMKGYHVYFADNLKDVDLNYRYDLALANFELLVSRHSLYSDAYQSEFCKEQNRC